MLKIIWRTAAFIILTTLSQTGGLIYIACFNSKFSSVVLRITVKILSFAIIYLLLTFTIVPLIAKQFGRVQLPAISSDNLKPLNILTCVLNRNYVRPALREVAKQTAVKMNELYPGTIVYYLDASFPFINKFPLIPHLSHNDGKKLDLAFFYTDPKTNKRKNGAPSPIGYGICEEPLAGEINTSAMCSEKGFWQYSFLRKIMPQGNKKNYLFDLERTKEMITIFSASNEIEKIFIEPHLTIRMQVKSYPKIRFHGCQAVRHDDHLHVQIK